MKRDTLEPPPVFDNKFDKIKYYFKNVYWFHYKWHAFAVIVIGALAVSFIVTFLTQRDPDILVLIVCENYLDRAVAEQLQDELAEYVGDANGDGKPMGEILTMNFTDPATEMAARTMLVANVQRDDIMLIIADEWSLEQISELIPFRDISSYIPGGERLVDVSGSKKIQSMSPELELKLFAGLVEKEHDDAVHIEVPVKAIEFFLSN